MAKLSEIFGCSYALQHAAPNYWLQRICAFCVSRSSAQQYIHCRINNSLFVWEMGCRCGVCAFLCANDLKTSQLEIVFSVIWPVTNRTTIWLSVCRLVPLQAHILYMCFFLFSYVKSCGAHCFHFLYNTTILYCVCVYACEFCWILLSQPFQLMLKSHCFSLKSFNVIEETNNNNTILIKWYTVLIHT